MQRAVYSLDTPVLYCATVKVLPVATVVSPFRLMAPVPVMKVPVPVGAMPRFLLKATATSPLKVAVPVPVANLVTSPLRAREALRSSAQQGFLVLKSSVDLRHLPLEGETAPERRFQLRVSAK